MAGPASILPMPSGVVGATEARLGRRAEAAATLREAIAAWEAIPEPDRLERRGRSTWPAWRSLLSGVLAGPGPEGDGRGGPGPRPTGRWRPCATRSRRGFRNTARLRTDPDLNAIRPRPDFQLLLFDLAFPQEPFAP